MSLNVWVMRILNTEVIFSWFYSKMWTLTIAAEPIAVESVSCIAGACVRPGIVAAVLFTIISIRGAFIVL